MYGKKTRQEEGTLRIRAHLFQCPKRPLCHQPPNLRQNAVSTQISLRSAERRKRLPLLEELAKARKSAVLAYVTVGRKNLGTVVGSDVIRIFHDHLSAMGQAEKD